MEVQEAQMKISQYISEIAIALVIIGIICVFTTPVGLGVVMCGLILGILGIVIAPSKKKRILGIIAVVSVPIFYALLICWMFEII